jgi:class 3 adenylate cyclase
LPPGAVFCNGCGHDLSQPPARAAATEAHPPRSQASEGERRQATVLFSDLSGYTAMNEKLDPEEVGTLMGRIKEEAVGVVEEHGGIVNQFVGDEVLALFGIPTAHKDDPRRAVRAALELHKLARRISPEVEERIGRGLRMHTGIDTGLIVTNTRDVRDGTFGITGDTINTGARLKALAEDDQILLSPETHQRVAAYFETTALHPMELKGKGLPLTPYRVAGEYPQPRQGQQAFVGRTTELHQCAGVLEDCLQTGRGQTLYVRGEAGIGKTRLVEEFRALAQGRGFACHTGLILDFGIGKGRDAIRAIVGARRHPRHCAQPAGHRAG